MKAMLPSVLCLLLLSALGVAVAQPSATEGTAKISERTEKERESSKESGAGRADHAIDPAKFQRELLENLIIEETNRRRASKGLKALRKSERLTEAARSHSADMANRNYFSHDTKKVLKNGSFAGRIKTDGYAPRGLAENIAMQPVVYRRTTKIERAGGKSRPQTIDDGHTYNSMAQTVVKQWMESPGHRKNIMDGTLTHIGLGCAVGEKDGFPYIYFTQDFAAEAPE